jgi:hypothetical protein
VEDEDNRQDGRRRVRQLHAWTWDYCVTAGAKSQYIPIVEVHSYLLWGSLSKRRSRTDGMTGNSGC